jgi:type I restriction enzyme, S subunit
MQTVALSEIANLESGSVFPNKHQGEPSGDLAFAKVSDISRVVRAGKRNINLARNYLSRQKAKELKTKIFPPKTIVFAKIGEAIKGNMRAITTCEMLFDNNVMGVSPNSENVDEIFLFHFLNTLDFYLLANKTSVPALRKSDLQKIRVPLPQIAEQKRIAAILDKAEEIRSQRRQALEQLDAIGQSIFLEMFGDPAINPKKWEISKLGDISEQITDGEHQTPKRTLEGIKLLSARNVQDGYIDVRDVDYIGIEEHERIKKRCNPVRGDILISCSGTIGRVAMVETDEPFSLVRSAALVKLKSNSVDSKFFEYFLRTPTLRKKMQQRANASSQANLFQNQIRELPAFIPPIALQQEFARRVETIAQLKTTHRESLAQMDDLFASLQHQAFRGEL